MLKIRAGMVACFCIFSLAASSQQLLRFDDVWYLFTHPFSKADSFLLKKGYKLQPAPVESNKLVKTFTGPVVNRNVYKVVLTRAYYDSLIVTGINLETDMQEMDSLEKSLAKNHFMVNPEYTVPGYTGNAQVQEWISIKHLLVCTILFNFPKQWQSQVSYTWHDLSKGSIPVYKKENNFYLTTSLLKEYDTTELAPYANNLSFSSFSDPPAFRGGNGVCSLTSITMSGIPQLH